jgi:hypothetical protein
VAGFEPAADGYLQTRIKAAPSTVHSSAKLLRARRNVFLLSYTPFRFFALRFAYKDYSLTNVKT